MLYLLDRLNDCTVNWVKVTRGPLGDRRLVLWLIDPPLPFQLGAQQVPPLVENKPIIALAPHVQKRPIATITVRNDCAPFHHANRLRRDHQMVRTQGWYVVRSLLAR